MDRNYIDLHLTVDRYLGGSLADDEKTAFEERLVWDQELIDELDLADRLRNGLREAVAEDKFVGTRVDVGIVQRLASLMAVPQYAAAASFLLAVTLTTAVLMKPVDSVDNFQLDRAAPTQIVPLFTVRSLDVQQIVVDEKALTVLLVDAPGNYESYRASVRRDEPGSEPFWVQDGLLPTYPDSLAISMPGSTLSPGSYVMHLEGARDAGAAVYEHIHQLHFETVAE